MTVLESHALLPKAYPLRALGFVHPPINRAHISHDDCMEVIALRGKARGIRELANALLSLKGVKHGKLFLTLPAREIVARRKAAHSHARHKHKEASAS